MKHQSSFSIKSWVEEELIKLNEQLELKNGRVERDHQGYISGKEIMHYHFAYTNHDRSEFNGIGIFDGSIGERRGTFIFIEHGSYLNGGVVVEFEVRKMSENSDIGIVLGKGAYETSSHNNIPYDFEESL